MSQNAPGKSFRKGLSLIEITRMYPDNATAEAWFINTRWPDGVHCPYCNSASIQSGASHKTMPYRCRNCRKRFSVRTGSVMQASNLSYQVWAIATYLLMTNLKSVSSLKLHRDLGIGQKAAWHLAHRLREALTQDGVTFAGPVEVDETYVGGVESNKHASKKLKKGRGAVGKVAVIGMKDRKTNAVVAKPIEETDRFTLQGFVLGQIEPGAKVYTDEHAGYDRLPNHESVKHSAREYVNYMAHTNGIESLWALLKRAYHGTFHHVSGKHLGRYVTEFSGRHNNRPSDTIEQMRRMVHGMVGRRLRYRDLVGSK